MLKYNALVYQCGKYARIIKRKKVTFNIVENHEVSKLKKCELNTVEKAQVKYCRKNSTNTVKKRTSLELWKKRKFNSVRDNAQFNSLAKVQFQYRGKCASLMLWRKRETNALENT